MACPIRIHLIAMALLFSLGLRPAESSARLFLQILQFPEGRVLQQFPVWPGDLFQLRYTHSSDRTPVQDIFRVGRDGDFVLLEERYRWYGAGLESHPRAGISFDGDWTRVTVNRPMRELRLRVGRVSNPVIRSVDREIILGALAPGGSLLLIRIVER